MDTITNRSNDKRLIVEFAGWIQCDPEETQFQYIGAEQYGLMSTGNIITGDEYMALSSEQQGDYVLECLGKSYIHSLDGECDHLTVEVEEI